MSQNTLASPNECDRYRISKCQNENDETVLNWFKEGNQFFLIRSELDWNFRRADCVCRVLWPTNSKEDGCEIQKFASPQLTRVRDQR